MKYMFYLCKVIKNGLFWPLNSKEATYERQNQTADG